MQTKVRGLNSSGGEVDIRASEAGQLHTLPYQIVWTAKGYSRAMMSTTAVASLVVRPSTTAAAHLYNNAAGGGVHYVIERIFAHNLVTDIEEVGSLWVCVHPVGMTAPGNDVTTNRSSFSGLSGAAGTSQWAIDESVSEDGWFPWGNWLYTNLDGTVPSGHCEAEVNGRIIIPPTAGLSMHVVSSTTTNTYCIGAQWFEVPESELAIT